MNRQQSTPGRRKQQLFVFQELLPGDVFLVSSWAATSIGIKLATWSRFSHAAIYLGAGRYFEATPDHGSHVGCLEVHKCGVNSESNVPRTLLYHPDWRRVVVLRHRRLIGAGRIAPEKQKALRDDVYRAMLVHRGLEYAALSDLGAATRLPIFAGHVKTVLSKVERMTGAQKSVPGMFCSAAVACILADAGLAPTTLPAANVSPGTLAHRKSSSLKRVPACLTSADSNVVSDSETLREFELLLKDKSPVTHVNDWSRRQRLELRKLEGLHTKVRRMNISLGRMLDAQRAAP